MQREKQNEGRERKNISFIVYICLGLSDSRRGKIFGGYKYFSANNKRQTLNCMPVGLLLIQTHPNKDCTSTLHYLHFSQKHLPKMNQVSRSET